MKRKAACLWETNPSLRRFNFILEPFNHYIAFSSEKVVCLNQERNMHSQNNSKQICGWILMWETTGNGLFHWRKFYYGLWTHILARSQKVKVLKLKRLNDGFVSYKRAAFASQYVNWWTGGVWITCGLLWCFYQLFGLSFWRHPFTAEHSLLSKWCNNKFLIFQQIVIFGVDYSFKCLCVLHCKKLLSKVVNKYYWSTRGVSFDVLLAI